MVRVWSTWNDQVSNERSKIVRRVCRRCRERFQYSVLKVWTMSSLGLVAQLVRAPPCHGGGRRFESDLGRLYYEWGILAQLGEHLPYKQRVTGSSPVGPILLCINWICRCGSIGRAADLYSAGYRFESDHRLCEKLDLSCFSYGWIPEWPKGTDCKSAGNAFEGSNPSPPIVLDVLVLGVTISSKMVARLL